MNQAPPFVTPSSHVASTLRVNSHTLWKVTLGFLPVFVNLHKRLTEPEDESLEEEDSYDSSVSKNMIRSIEISEEVPEVESVSDISDSSYYSEYSSTSSYSDYASASSGWSAADPDLQAYTNCNSEDFSSCIGSSKSGSTTYLSFSNSYYDFARKPKEQVNEKTGTKTSKTTRWVQKFSRVLLGSDECNHTV